MPASFFDSNVLLYFASSDPAKAARAEQVMRPGGVISVQVLNEIASVARRKMKLSWAETHDVLGLVRAQFQVEPLTIETHELGVELAERHRLSIYDSTIVASAILAECDTLLSEDMHDGLVVDGRLTIRNPFRSPN
jgi:predicted nucleic acid-binding protein